MNSRKYIYTVKLGIVGNIQTESAINKYLKETLETQFLERGENIEFCFIDEINTQK